MSGVSKEFKIGTIVVISITLLIIGMNYLKGVNIFIAQRKFHAIYSNVDGLRPSNPVILNGYKIGQVQKVGFHPSGSGDLVVTFSIDQKELKIPADTKAKIFDSDFFGSKAIELIIGSNTNQAQSGDTLTSEIQMGLAEAVRIELIPLKQKTDELIQGVDDILNNLKVVFADDATQGLPKVFESLQRTMNNLEETTEALNGTIQENKQALNGIFDNVLSITNNLESNNEKLSNIITNFDAISDSLAKVQFAATLKKADKALGDVSGIMEKINTGQGSLGMLINNDTLHTSLLETNKEVQYLINDLYMNPWKYVHVSIFGKKPKEKFSRQELEQLRELIDEELEQSK
ncbi:MAG: hypothetical protein RL226_877 [Bacteroidota bacterium]